MSETTTFAAITATIASTTAAETLVAQFTTFHQAAATTSSVTEYYGGNQLSLAANVVYIVAFFAVLIVQSILGILYREWWFFISWFCGIGLEVIGYIGRAWSSKHLDSLTAYAMQMSCLTFAPSFLMAGIYYILAQLVSIFGVQYSFLKPMTYTRLFICVDVACIFLQAGGGGVASSGNSKVGSNIMLAGLILQVVTMGIFQGLWYMFICKIYKANKTYGDSAFDPQYTEIRARGLLRWFIIAVCISVTLIFARSTYRIVEFAQGWDSKLANNQIFVLTLDGLLVWLAAVTLTVMYPGVAYGRNNNLKITKNSSSIEARDSSEKYESKNYVTVENPFLNPVNERYSRSSNV